MRYKIAAGLLFVALAISIFFNYQSKQKLVELQKAMDIFLPAARMLEQQNLYLKQELSLKSKFPEIDQKALQDSVRALFKIDSSTIKNQEMNPSQFNMDQPQTNPNSDFKDLNRSSKKN